MNPNDSTGMIRFSFDITKVDAEQRLVEGIASSEVKDWQGDVIPFDVAKNAFEAAADTMGVREMHQPKVIGTFMKWWPIEDARQIGAQIFISRSRDGEDALTKVKERALKGFSIGGRATDWQYDQQARVIKSLALTELSLVDVPANPEAIITLFKAEADQAAQKPVNVPGIQEEPKAVSPGNPPTPPQKGVKEVDAGQPVNAAMRAQKAIQNIPNLRHIQDGETNACANCKYARYMGSELYCRAYDSMVRPDWVCDYYAPATGDPDAEFVPLESTDSIGKAADDEKAKIEAQLEARGRTVGISRKKGEPLTPPKGYPTDPSKYADPANWSWPMEPATRAQAAVGYYNAGAGKGKYSPKEWAILGRRIARMAGSALGGSYSFDANEKKITTPKQREESKMSADQINKDGLGSLLSNVRSQIGELSSTLETGTSMSDAVTQVMAALDVAIDSAGDGKEAAAPKPGSSPSSDSEPDTGDSTGQGGNTKPVTPKASASTPGKITPASQESDTMTTKAIDDRLDKMTDVLEKLTELVTKQAEGPKQRPVVSAGSKTPAGDIPKKGPEISPVAKALTDGDLMKAVEAAGDSSRLYEQVDTLVKGQLADMGINVSRFYSMGFPTRQTDA